MNRVHPAQLPEEHLSGERNGIAGRVLPAEMPGVFTRRAEDASEQTSKALLLALAQQWRQMAEASERRPLA